MSDKMILIVFDEDGAPVEIVVTFGEVDVCPHCFYSGGGNVVRGWYRGERQEGLRCVACGFMVLSFYYDRKLWLDESRRNAGSWQSDS